MNIHGAEVVIRRMIRIRISVACLAFTEHGSICCFTPSMRSSKQGFSLSTRHLGEGAIRGRYSYKAILSISNNEAVLVSND